jgi:hypothetical protein
MDNQTATGKVTGLASPSRSNLGCLQPNYAIETDASTNNLFQIEAQTHQVDQLSGASRSRWEVPFQERQLRQIGQKDYEKVTGYRGRLEKRWIKSMKRQISV